MSQWRGIDKPKMIACICAVVGIAGSVSDPSGVALQYTLIRLELQRGTLLLAATRGQSLPLLTCIG